ncbi:LacI family DNA-binding transcriptional regulator [Leifsonia sp. NPDC080035]|uniref:LacI family DNA-binding transcriptional regulator n=1 Tax=Leifsonia sp. NPDC080035 TaxID=3143936 RepID=A0AAU7GF45_9MICO
MSRIGITDVAVEANVSPATVSRVINNRGIVAPETRRTVEEAMRRVGYTRGATGDLVALIVPGLIDPFFGLISEQLGLALSPLGMRALVCSAPAGSVQEFEFISSLSEAGIVGAVFVSASNTLDGADTSAVRLLEKRRTPFVCINGGFAGVSAPTLSTNDELAAEISVEHLWDLGHRRIGLIAGPVGNRPSDRRVRGFERAMTKRGGTPSVVRSHYSIEGGYSAASQLLESGTTAVVAASDDMALGTIRAARWLGLAVPDDVSVIGYDDAYPFEFVDPPLTTVRQPIDRLAKTVAPILSRLVRGDRMADGELLFDPELIPRASTAKPRDVA